MKAILESVLPRALSRLVLTPDRFKCPGHGPDVRIEFGLQRHHLPNRVDGAGRIGDPPNRRSQPAALVSVTDDRGEELGAVGEMQIQRLSRDTRGSGDIGHPDVGPAAPDHEPERGIEDAAPRGRVPSWT